ncbi:hypothetical protein NFX46_15485 [Streptomyces phaeoluteigriseus]|uniref:Bacterial Ig-like domain-containing protein n=1 Tax=Streptomyces phaeoluteigriseus TaxID=114686 RepID=A0ABY4Z945_9ACTN|nr:hypothetical protein [Streptomyces phaeoluteigriseus]USQ85068.1 hypothetical protein NFX46_15485 [Streptomyces phaeoluteigriseus]
MTSHRPTSSPASPSGVGRGRIGGRVLALTAGTALGLGALSPALPVAAGSGGRDTVTLAADADPTAPAVTLGTNTVRAGGEVSFTVAGFPAGGTLSVKLDDKALLKQFAVGADGTASGAVTVPADTAAGGGHWLRFLATGTSVRSADLTVTAESPSPTPPAPAADPAVKLTAGATVTAGAKVAFGLSGFVEGQTVTVKLDDGTILQQFTGAVAADGTFSGSVTIPASTSAGAHWLRFLAPDPATSLRADIKVTAAATGGGGGPGGSDGGTGTSGGSGGTGGSTGGSGSSGGTGTGTGGSSTGGTGTGGSTSGGGGSSASASATVTAGSRVVVGGEVSFRVTGFPAGERLTVKLDDVEIIGQWQGGIGSDGSFSGSVTIPADTPVGAHWLRFLAPNPATSVKAAFTVTSSSATASSGTSGAGTAGPSGAAATPVPAASGEPVSATNSAGAKAEITASEVQAGGTLHFTVTRFPAGQTVTVKLDDEAVLGQWTADAQGSYEGDVTVPADTPAGAHWLRFLAPNPPTSLKVGFTVTAATGAVSSSTTAPDTTEKTLAAAATSVEAPVSYATIAWSAGAAAAGGAVGAAATTLFVVRRRPSGSPAGG